MNNSTLTKVTMKGFVIINRNSSKVVFFGSRDACRDYRKNQKNMDDFTGPQSVNVGSLAINR